MKALRLVALFYVLLTLSQPSVAEICDVTEAGLAGEAFLAELNAAGELDRATQSLPCRELRREGRLLGFLIPLTPAGHMVLSPLRELPAIKAWSLETDFDPAAEGGYSDLVMDTLESTLDFLEQTYGNLEALPPDVAPAVNRAGWERLLSGQRSQREDDVTVGPIIESVWHQSAPYYNDCPPGDGGICVVGCVATSAAMILKYWEYPEYGEGSHSYYWPGDTSCGGSSGGGTLYATFADPYDWDNILHSYAGGYSSIEAEAAAELNYECGVAFEMQYGVCGSGSYVTMAEYIYAEYFRYADTVEFINRSGYTQEEWFEIIRGELDTLPPRAMHYRISGHSIICDGYRVQSDQPYYHMNYGWGGSQNAWFALDNVYCPWDGCNYLVEAMAIGIEPLGYFNLSQPLAGTILHHGDLFPEVHWDVCDGESVRIALYEGNEFVEFLSDWIPNDGSEDTGFVVSSAWGTGSAYRVKVTSDARRFGWSGEFGIYGEDAWTDISSPLLADEGLGRAVAWGDCDGDGLADLYVSNHDSGNLLLGNQAGGGFVDLSAPPLDISASSRGAAWADVDNDGDLDLYLACTSGDVNHLYLNEGDGFGDESGLPLGDPSFSEGAAWGDYDNDGLVDLYIVNVFAADKLLHNEGGGVFSDATAEPLGDEGYGRSASWIDYDDDGDLDLYLVRQGQNRLYSNEGGGSFQIVYGTLLADDGDGFGGAWADYDNDGDLDLYIGNSGANKLLQNDGGGVFSEVVSSVLADEGNCRGVAWADYDNDGDLDLYLGNVGANKLLNNVGGAVFSNVTDLLLGDLGASAGLGFCDVDADGDLDLYLANGDGPNRLFQNDNQTGNGWLQLDLVGTRSNASALGARVKIWAGGWPQTRQVGGDAGYLSRNSLTLAFGLGSASIVDSLRVYWPAGGSELLADVSINQRLLITEESTGIAQEGIARFHLAGNFPNPFNPTTEIRFSLAESGEVEIDIHDLQGRLLRRLLTGTWFTNGNHSVTWSGRDDKGRELPSGIYFCRMRVGDLTESRKMTLLK